MCQLGLGSRLQPTGSLRVAAGLHALAHRTGQSDLLVLCVESRTLRAAGGACASCAWKQAAADRGPSCGCQGCTSPHTNWPNLTLPCD